MTFLCIYVPVMDRLLNYSAPQSKLTVWNKHNLLHKKDKTKTDFWKLGAKKKLPDPPTPAV